MNTLIEFLNKIDQEIPLSISTKIPIEKYIRKILNNGIMLIAMHEDNLLGLCGFYCNDYKSNIAFLTIIGVSPSCRGNSIASSLLKEAIASSRTHGMQTMRLETSPDNATARSFYKKHGFTEYTKTSDKDDDTFNIYLECNLSRCSKNS